MRIFFLLIFLCSQAAFAQTKATRKLFTGIAKNNLAMVENALREGAHPNSKDHPHHPTNTALIRAVELRRFEIVRVLLGHHADVNLRKPVTGETPLMVAARHDLAAITQLLLIYGADVNLVSPQRRSALHISAFRNSLSVAQLLLQVKDIDVNAHPHLCALAMAAREGHTSFVLLLKKQTGAKASSPLCVEKALDMARAKNLPHIEAVLLR